MKHTLRAASFTLKLALLLAVVGALAELTVLAVVKLLVVAVMAGGGWSVGAVMVVVGILATVGVGLLVRRRRRQPLVGVPVTSDEEPLLWVEIIRVADGLGTRPPDEVSLVPDALVAASEHGNWLGLRPGVRRLSLGLPLLAGLTERQLRAVVTHELCRRWGPSWLGRITQRGKEVIGRLVDHTGKDSRFGRTFRRLDGRYRAAYGPLCRRHELEADRLSAELAGNGATSAALRELAVLSGGWDAFVKGYAQPARALGRRPHDVFAGFARFLEDPDRRAQLAREAGAPASQQLSSYGSALSLGERLDVIASLPEDDLLDKSGPAIYLLRDPQQVIRRVDESMFREPGLVPATWEDIVPEVGRAAAYQDALQLARLANEGGLGPTLSVAALVEIISLGLAEEMVRPMLADGASQEAERQWAARLMTGFFATAAVESGTASYRFSWAAPGVLVDDQGDVDNLPRLVDTVLADQKSVPALELWLTSHHVGQELELAADLGQAVREGLPSGPYQSSPDGPDEDNPEDPGEVLVSVSGTAST